MGGMTSETGLANEAVKYAIGQDLPIEFIIEINHKSVCTDTLPTWGLNDYSLKGSPKVKFYEYELPWPHAGAGKRVQFLNFMKYFDALSESMKWLGEQK